jgi:hypothetical protein
MEISIKKDTRHNISKIYYKGVYKGRVVKESGNDDTKSWFEFQEKGHNRFPLHLQEYESEDDAIKFAVDRIQRQVESAEDRIEVMGLTEKGRKFLLKFKEPVLRKLLNSEERKMISYFHAHHVVEKGVSDDKQKSVIYYLDVNVKKKLEKLDTN